MNPIARHFSRLTCGLLTAALAFSMVEAQEVLDNSADELALTSDQRVLIARAVAGISDLANPSRSAIYGLSRATNADSSVICGFTDNVRGRRAYAGVRAFFVYLEDGAIVFDGAPLPEHEGHSGAGTMLDTVGCPRFWPSD